MSKPIETLPEPVEELTCEDAEAVRGGVVQDRLGLARLPAEQVGTALPYIEQGNVFKQYN